MCFGTMDSTIIAENGYKIANLLTVLLYNLVTLNL